MVLDLFSLKGKVAIVTGVSGGIGQAITVALAEAGADIVGVYNSHSPVETQAAVEAAGRRFVPVQADFCDPSNTCKVLEAALEAFGHVDILCNNSGINHRLPAHEMPEEIWDKILNVNLKQVFLLSKAVANQFLKQGTGGKIINTASMVSFFGGTNLSAYATSKHAVAGLTKSMASDLAAKGINVNAIAPGFIETSMTKALAEDAERSASILARVPAQRWGRPEDFKGIAVFLASDASNFLNGAIIPVDGGYMAK